MNRGLYIHFPFCQKKCNYCDFYSVADNSKIDEYISALCRDILKLKDENLSFDTIYFGGGTPSLMKPSALEKILLAVTSSASLEKGTEITLEANPMSAGDREKLISYKALGVNRLSLGVQSFNDSELISLGRGHSARDARETLSLAHTCGFDSVSLDLMFALPHQTLDSFGDTLKEAVASGVEHISLYALSIEDKTVFGRKQRAGENLFLPDEDVESEMYMRACETLSAKGFEHYEISNFAKSSKCSRHNLKYWNGEEYIGIGAGAHGYYNSIRYFTPPSVSAFLQNPEREIYEKNSAVERATEYAMLRLRLRDGLNLTTLEHTFGATLNENGLAFVKELKKDGLCTFDGKTISLTDRGFFVSNTIILKILESLNFPLDNSPLL